MIATQTTFHHTANFPLFFDLVLERGTELVERVVFLPVLDFSNKTLLWLIQKDNAPLFALTVTEENSSKLIVSASGEVTIHVHTALSKQLKPYAYSHALMMKDKTTGETEMLLTGELKVEQHSRMWQAEGENEVLLPDITDTNNNGVPDNLDDVWNGLLNLDPLLRQLTDSTAHLHQTTEMLRISLQFI